jgi:hypothetical protein
MGLRVAQDVARSRGMTPPDGEQEAPLEDGALLRRVATVRESCAGPMPAAYSALKDCENVIQSRGRELAALRKNYAGYSHPPLDQR